MSKRSRLWSQVEWLSCIALARLYLYFSGHWQMREPSLTSANRSFELSTQDNSYNVELIIKEETPAMQLSLCPFSNLPRFLADHRANSTTTKCYLALFSTPSMPLNIIPRFKLRCASSKHKIMPRDSRRPVG